MTKAALVVHPYNSFVPEDFDEILQNEKIEEVYAVGSANRNYGHLCGAEYIDQSNIFYDGQGRGSFPPKLANELEDIDELVFMGGKLSECVPRAVRTYYQKYGDVENLAVEINSVYEPTGDGFESLAEVENRNGDIPSTFSDVGGILDQYDWFS